MEIYHFSRTRSQRALWIAEELGIQAELKPVNLMEGEQRKPEYLAIHPLGFVPAVREGNETLLESAAIVMWLADQHADKGLAPAIDSPERAKYLQWCVFGPAELDPHIADITQHTMLLPEDMRNPDIAARARDRFIERAQVLSKVLESQPFLLGEKFYACDVIIGHNCVWAGMTGLLNDFPVLQDYFGRVSQRPGYQKAYAGIDAITG